jgi:hypothetical protein
MSIFVDGELSRYSFWTSKGLLDTMAETEVSGSTVILKDPAVYSGDGMRIHVGVRVMLEIVRQIEALAKLQGFTRLQLTGQRLSGATPGRSVYIDRRIR